MGCNCTARWTRWASMGDGELVMLEVESRCTPAEIAVVQQPGGNVEIEIGFGHDTIRIPAGQLPAPAPAPAIPVPCKITYVIKNAAGCDYNIVSFSTGADTYNFAPPIGPNQAKTIQATSSLPGPGECYRASTGTLELVHSTSGAHMTIGEIKICRLRDPD